MNYPVIAIDGPAAVGKTTVGRMLADRLGWAFLDTGVLYRALAWQAVEQGVPPGDARRLAALARELDVQVRRPTVADGRDADVLVAGRDVTWSLRAPQVDATVSIVAALPEVRAALVPVQRRVAARGPAVVAGRDIGTIIYPDAALKVFLTAGPAERARRRALDLAAHGATSELGAVLTDLERRDALDSGRAHAPLVAAPDAVQVDTEGRDADEVVEAILALWRARQEGQA